MKKHFIAAICAVLFLSFTLSSCDTPTGQGAGWGAATGALIGAAATGDAEGAASVPASAPRPARSSARRSKQTSAVIMMGRPAGSLSLCPADRNIRVLFTVRIRRTTSSTCAAFRMARWCAILRRAEFSASRSSAVRVDFEKRAGREQDQLVFFCSSSTMRCASSSIRTSSGQSRRNLRPASLRVASRPMCDPMFCALGA